MTPRTAALLAAACLCLAASAFSGLLLAGGRRRARAAAARIELAVGAYRNLRGEAGGAGIGLRAASLAGRTERLLRYDPSRPHVYKARPAGVLALCLAPSLAVSHGLAGFLGPLGWLAAPLGCLALARAFYGRCEDRHQARLYAQFPDALATIVRAVRVGLPVVEAIRVVARESPEPTAQEFAALVAQTAIGVALDDALREMAERNRLPEYRFFATALSLQSQTGGGLTETLENLAETIRKRSAAKMRGHALAAEARMSSYILGGLPVVTGALLWVVNPDYVGVLFYDPSGRMLLLAGATLLGLGGTTMRVMITKSLS